MRLVSDEVRLFQCSGIIGCTNEGVLEVKLDGAEDEPEGITVYFCPKCAEECLEVIPSIN